MPCEKAMKQIVVDEQQAEVIRSSARSIQVLDSAGKIIGYVTPAPPEAEIERIKARLAEGPSGPVYTTEQVMEHLSSLGKS